MTLLSRRRLRCHLGRLGSQRAVMRTLWYLTDWLRLSKSSRNPESEAPERMPKLSYNLLSEKQLRKKLTELGIPPWGSKALMTRRHTEWVDLVAANCDSDQPKTKRWLLRDLDEWERTQGGLIAAGNKDASQVIKDIKSEEWSTAHSSTAHSSNFKDLIAQARRPPKKIEKKKKSEDAQDQPPDGND